ncbi:MAG: hypothetical protein AAFY02_15470 [Pseudomonadota bacterium]
MGAAILLQAAQFPWPPRWSEQSATLRRISEGLAGLIAMEKTFGPLVQILYRSLEVAHDDPEQEKKLFDSKGDYLGALWFVHLYWVRLSHWKHTDALAKDKKEAEQRATATARMMIKALKDLKGDVATILRYKASANILVAEWNAIRPEARRQSSRLQGRVEDLDFFNATLAQADIVPKNLGPLENALGVASAFHRREHYATFEDRIAKIDPERIQTILSPPETDLDAQEHYNKDFDDFRQWVAEGRPAGVTS